METYRRVIPDAVLDLLCSDDVEIQQIGFIMLNITASDLVSLVSKPHKRFIFKVLRIRLAERDRYVSTNRNRRRIATRLVTIKRHVRNEKIKKERWEKKARLRSQNSRIAT
jgi:hypothetical protein